MASIIAAIAALGTAGAVSALMFRIVDNKNRALTAKIDLIALIDALLPQTQCGECGYMGCKPYAEAIARGEAINRCPPGGDTTIAALASLLDKPIVALDGIIKPDRVAFIREAECIGCTKCIQACPVDAIVGAAKLMHTVIADECTGCDLCVEPCPVDCIDMLPIERSPQPARYRRRFLAHQERVQREGSAREQRRAQRVEKIATKTTAAPNKNKQDEIRAAIARAKAKKSAQQQPPADNSGNDNARKH